MCTSSQVPTLPGDLVQIASRCVQMTLVQMQGLPGGANGALGAPVSVKIFLSRSQAAKSPHTCSEAAGSPSRARVKACPRTGSLIICTCSQQTCEQEEALGSIGA